MAKLFYHMPTPGRSEERLNTPHSAIPDPEIELKKVVSVETTPVHDYEYAQAQANASRPEYTIPTDTVTGKLQHTVHSWWLWELTAWLISSLALAAIAIFLSTQDGKPVPNWVYATDAFNRHTEFRLTINSVVSIMSTVMKSMIAIPVAAATSQLKWLWFQDSHALADFQKFDSAGRGPLGAVMLLWSLRGRQIACIGAVLTVAMLGLDFSFQSLITYPLRPQEVDVAIMPTNQFYAEFDQPSLDLNSKTPVPLMISSIKTVGDALDLPVPFSPVCSTGNCTWEYAYASLAICSECHDVTPLLEESCGSFDTEFTLTTESSTTIPIEYCNYTFPGVDSSARGLRDLFIAGIMVDDETGSNVQITKSAVVSSNYFVSPFFPSERLSQPIAHIATINSSPEYILHTFPNDSYYGYQEIKNVRAQECALFFCVAKYHATVDAGVFKETLNDTYVDLGADFDSDFPDLTKSEFVVDNRTMSLAPPDSFFTDTSPGSPRRFNVSYSSYSGLFQYFLPRYTGYVRWISDTSTPTVFTELDSGMVGTIANMSFGEIDSHVASMAGNMTIALRVANENGTATNPNSQGVAMQHRPYVQVNWPWIVFPAALLALTLLYLVMTMIKSAARNAMVWKGSSLATFYHPLTKDGRDLVAGVKGPLELERMAQEVQVHWIQTEKGPRLVRVESDRAMQAV